LLSVVSVAQAEKEIRDRFSDWTTGEETVPLIDALERILAHDIISTEDIPGFHRSTVDGYAVHAADTFGASEAFPSMLTATHEVAMGHRPDFIVNRGQCAYVPTGGELPQGLDAVVMMEYVEDYGDGNRYVLMSVAPGANVIFRGDDVTESQLVLRKGMRIRPQEIGALAAMGIGQVPVYRALRVGVLSSGDELVDVNEPLTGAMVQNIDDPRTGAVVPDMDSLRTGAVVRDVNSYTIAAGLAAIGAIPVSYGIVKDDYDTLSSALRKALAACDAVIISGGSSVGTADITHRIIDEAGKPGVFVHGLAVKPGKPTIVGDIDGKIVFGLPGHPVSAYMIFRILAAPIFSALMGQRSGGQQGDGGQLDGGRLGDGWKSDRYRSVSAHIGRNVPSNHGREEYLPVKLYQDTTGSSPIALPVVNKSGLITTLCEADGFVCIPRDQEGLSAGDPVTVLLF